MAETKSKGQMVRTLAWTGCVVIAVTVCVGCGNFGSQSPPAAPARKFNDNKLVPKSGEAPVAAYKRAFGFGGGMNRPH
jgi:hypothetical protein